MSRKLIAIAEDFVGRDVWVNPDHVSCVMPSGSGVDIFVSGMGFSVVSKYGLEETLKKLNDGE